MTCFCCKAQKVNFFKKVDNYEYFQCDNCKTIFIDNKYLAEIDNGFNVVCYDGAYWAEELISARERAFGVALARMAEVYYYSRIPINRFIDIGTGPGYFLDAVEKYLPNNCDCFYGVEKYPPPRDYRTQSKNYIVGDLDDINYKFDAGLCMEVIEHLTPRMLRKLLASLARVSNEGAIYIFNTGLPEFVIKEDPSYIDPINRGHIVSYSLKAIEILSKGLGFSVLEIPGKTWAFALEYTSKVSVGESIQDRIWSPLDFNMNILTDNDMGSVLKVLGLETSRAYS